VTDPADLPKDHIEEFDPELFLAQMNRWLDLGGDESGPPEDWSEAVELIDQAYRKLAEARDLRETMVALSDAYAAVVQHHLGGS
jgi:hypothetical protein